MVTVPFASFSSFFSFCFFSPLLLLSRHAESPPPLTQMEEMFYNAVQSGNVEEMKEVLRRNPNYNANLRDTEDGDRTALHDACQNGHYSIVSILLTHPDIDVNLGTDDEETPFFWACYSGSTSCVRLLLKDARVKVNEPDDDGYTPLLWAATSGHLDIIK